MTYITRDKTLLTQKIKSFQNQSILSSRELLYIYVFFLILILLIMIVSIL